jgi:hypothetical protein
MKDFQQTTVITVCLVFICHSLKKLKQDLKAIEGICRLSSFDAYLQNLATVATLL